MKHGQLAKPIRSLITAAAAGLFVLAFSSSASAVCGSNQQTCSSNYGVNEVFFGTGGELNACSTGSTGYCSKQAAGELGVGNAVGSAAYQAQAGFNTDRTPSLTFAVTSTNLSLGTLSPGTTMTATAHFSVESYLASGYTVVAASDPPVSGAHTLQALATPTAANSSQEQFGINLVANTVGCSAPANFGADPVQVPDSTFSFGSAATGYNTCGLFKYVKGETVASSSKSSGETDYTISYIVSISNVTPAGTYTMNQVLVATGTF